MYPSKNRTSSSKNRLTPSKNKRGEDGLKIDAIHLKIDHRIQYRYVLLIIGLPSS